MDLSALSHSPQERWHRLPYLLKSRPSHYSHNLELEYNRPGRAPHATTGTFSAAIMIRNTPTTTYVDEVMRGPSRCPEGRKRKLVATPCAAEGFRARLRPCVSGRRVMTPMTSTMTRTRQILQFIGAWSCVGLCVMRMLRMSSGLACRFGCVWWMRVPDRLVSWCCEVSKTSALHTSRERVVQPVVFRLGYDMETRAGLFVCSPNSLK